MRQRQRSVRISFSLRYADWQPQSTSWWLPWVRWLLSSWALSMDCSTRKRPTMMRTIPRFGGQKAASSAWTVHLISGLQNVLDPTFPMLTIVAGSYLLSGLGFGFASLLIPGHKRRAFNVLLRMQALHSSSAHQRPIFTSHQWSLHPLRPPSLQEGFPSPSLNKN